jgi:16S rRNA (cytidine1402-2'-O)-methyltransferase
VVGAPLTAGTLYIVSTPIGNLGDITARAGEVLGACDLVFAEDTRTTRVLLNHLGIARRLGSLHEHNEARVAAGIVAALGEGRTVALVSDAGTPLVSDPGERLVARVVAAGHRVEAVPGASAVLAALVVSGLPAIPFTFLGFVPRRPGERRVFADRLADVPHTSVCYESPERLVKTLEGWAGAGLGERPAATCRELTKKFEDVRRGTVRELAAYHKANPPRGEVVIVLGGAVGKEADNEDLAALAARLLARGVPARDVARQLSVEHGVPRNVAYRLAHGKTEATT